MRRVQQWLTNLRFFELPKFSKAALPPFAAISPKIRVSSVRGYVDLIDIHGVAGWVLNEHVALDELAVHITIGTEYLGSARANIEAPDQIDLGLPSNARRFRFRFPHTISYADLPRVEVTEGATNQPLDGGFEYFRSYLAKKYATPELGGPYCLFFEARREFDQHHKAGTPGRNVNIFQVDVSVNVLDALPEMSLHRHRDQSLMLDR